MWLWEGVGVRVCGFGRVLGLGGVAFGRMWLWEGFKMCFLGGVWFLGWVSL